MPTHKLDLNLLYVFDAVMTERNVTRASRGLNMTQPAVSNAINRLRHVLEDDLFVKSGNGIMPTAKAESIWPSVHDALANIFETVAPGSFDPAHARDILRVGMSDYVAHQILLPFFAILEKEAPGVSLHLRPHTFEKVVALLEQGYLDMAAGVFAIDSAFINTMPLETVSYVCVMRRDHELAKGRLTKEKFLSARHLAVSLAGRRSVIDRHLDEQGVQRNIGLIVHNFSIVPKLLMETNLIGVFPLRTITNSSYKEHLRIVKSPVPIPSKTISLIWHSRSDNIPLYQWLRGKISKIPLVLED
jgi:DNA-binding transcriptional LysR family regulator